MQFIKKHKIITLFNLLAIFIMLFGMGTDFKVPDSGTSISGALVAWGGLLLIIMLIADGIVIARDSKRNAMALAASTNVNPQTQKKMSKVRGVSIISGVFIGILIAFLFSGAANSGADGSDMASGLVFIYMAPIFAALGAFVALTLGTVTAGDKAERRRALKIFIVVAAILAGILVLSYYGDKYGQKYCDGQPVEQYQGDLPVYCVN